MQNQDPLRALSRQSSFLHAAAVAITIELDLHILKTIIAMEEKLKDTNEHAEIFRCHHTGQPWTRTLV